MTATIPDFRYTVRPTVRPTASAEAERNLVARLQAGDRQALGDAYLRYGARVYAFALRRLRDPFEAEDVVQDVFVEISRSIGSFQGRSRLSTWIFGIASHEVGSRLRRRARHAVPVGSFGTPGATGEPELDTPASEPGPDRIADAARTLARCHAVLQAEVPASQREVFELHARGAGDVAAIASACGRTPQAVKISLFRTRRRLMERVPGLGEFLA